MFNLIEKLRAKPDRTKKQIAFLTALLIAGLIFIIWLTVVYPDFQQTQTQEARVANLEPSPLSSFINQISSGVSGITGRFSEIKSFLASFSATSEYLGATTTPPNP